MYDTVTNMDFFSLSLDSKNKIKVKIKASGWSLQLSLFDDVISKKTNTKTFCLTFSNKKIYPQNDICDQLSTSPMRYYCNAFFSILSRPNLLMIKTTL